MDTILVSGTSGYLGRGLVESLSKTFRLRPLDLSPCPEGQYEQTIASVTDLPAVRAAMDGVSA